MKIFRYARNFLFNRAIRFGYIAKLHGYYPSMDDVTYLKKSWRAKMGTELNLENPQTFNEKLQWLKLYDRNPKYTKLVDKYEVKKYVASKIGEEYIIPTIGVWNRFEDIDFDSLPQRFVLKTTHDSGGVVICKDKDSFDYDKAKEKLNRLLKDNFYYVGREWPYKDVKPRILAEKYIEDASTKELTDYKFMCFNGKVQCLFVCTERHSAEGLKVTFFDNNWNLLPFARHYPKSKKEIPCPRELKRMIEVAEQLSINMPFVRIDLYETDGKIYFGEFTFFPGCGFEEFNPKEWDFRLGQMIQLPVKEKI